MLYFPVETSENENVLKYFPNVYNFLLNKIKEKCSQTQTQQLKNLKELNNYFCSVLLDSFIQLCAEDDTDLFNYINSLNKNLTNSISNGKDFYSFNNGYLPANVYNQAKLNFNLLKIVKAIMDRFINTLNENSHETSRPIQQLANTIWENETFDPNIYLRVYFTTIFIEFFCNLNLNYNDKTKKFNEEDLSNLTLQQNIEAYLVNLLKSQLETDLVLRTLFSGDSYNI